ncbi:MAG: hypothetical protein ABI562_01555, partial [Chloroflexota bacterium]
MTDRPTTKIPSTQSDPGYAGSQVRPEDDLLNGGSGETESPVDPPNQGADPDADPDLLHGGTGELG